jgi:hypothetical protein
MANVTDNLNTAGVKSLLFRVVLREGWPPIEAELLGRWF